MRTVIHWFRRDLRIADNTALSEAARRAQNVIPVFIAEDAPFTGPDVGAARLAFLLRSLDSLRENLRELGCALIIRRGRPELELPKLCQETGAAAVFCNKGYEPGEKRRDERIFNALNAAGIGFESFKDAVVWEEQEVLTQAGRPFTVFTPYSKAWKARPIPAPRPGFKRRPPPVADQRLKSNDLPTGPLQRARSLMQDLPAAGERAAQSALRKFTRGPVYDYAATRDFPAAHGTSQLSPHLRCGTISVRTILAALKKARAEATPAQRKGCDVFLNELIWREFYQQVLANFPHVAQGGFRPEYNALQWSDDRDHFQAWREGMTGYPIVDAAMRCLNATGWMHNRLRMIVAMFLTKDLLIHWQSGERYFMHQLVDGDLAANNGGWQWSAGTGTDAAPYFRIFNPVAQGRKFDAHGAFVRRWVPELASLPDDFIHQPWKEPPVLKQTKYPKRIVVHEQQRPQCLALYQSVKRARAA